MGQKINPIGLRLGINRGWIHGLLEKRFWQVSYRRF